MQVTLGLGVGLHARGKIGEPVSSLVALQSTRRGQSVQTWYTHTHTGRLYFPVGLISIIRKRITHSLHAPSTWSVSLHSPHSPNSRYPLTRVAHLRSRHSLNLLLSPPFFRLGRRTTTIVPSVVHFASCHLPPCYRCTYVCPSVRLSFSSFFFLRRVTARRQENAPSRATKSKGNSRSRDLRAILLPLRPSRSISVSIDPHPPRSSSDCSIFSPSRLGT